MLPYKSGSLVQNVFAVHRFDRGPPIGSQENDRVSYLCSAPYTLLPLRGISPQGETRDMREKTASRILHVPFWRFPPLVADATTFPPLKRWDYGCLAMELCGAVRIGLYRHCPQGNTIKKAVKMAVLKFHQWNELLKSSIQKKDRSRLLP